MEQPSHFALGYRDAYKDKPFEDQEFEYLPFSDKKTYEAWVSGWKYAYRELSHHIRTVKQQRRGESMSESQTKAWSLGLEARGMLIERRFSKKFSWGMRNAAKYVESIKPHDIVDSQLAV